eukprot:SAG11_NODE_6801_length_1246_cov_1.931997_1_plen_158_part_00
MHSHHLVRNVFLSPVFPPLGECTSYSPTKFRFQKSISSVFLDVSKAVFQNFSRVLLPLPLPLLAPRAKGVITLSSRPPRHLGVYRYPPRALSERGRGTTNIIIFTFILDVNSITFTHLQFTTSTMCTVRVNYWIWISVMLAPTTIPVKGGVCGGLYL